MNKLRDHPHRSMSSYQRPQKLNRSCLPLRSVKQLADNCANLIDSESLVGKVHHWQQGSVLLAIVLILLVTLKNNSYAYY